MSLYNVRRFGRTPLKAMNIYRREMNGAKVLPLFLSVIIGVLFIQCARSEKPETMYVAANGGLRMRQKPNTTAKRVAIIPDGAKVILQEDYGEEIELSGRKGKWVKVEYNGVRGWVFGGFLVRPSAGHRQGKSDALTSIQGYYFSTAEVEPGHMQDWLSVDSRAVVAGYGGMVNPNWYCLVKRVVRSGKTIEIECDTSREPTSQEVPDLHPPDATARKSIQIRLLDSRHIAIGTDRFSRRDL